MGATKNNRIPKLQPDKVWLHGKIPIFGFKIIMLKEMDIQ
jgi:hypothetical protein